MPGPQSRLKKILHSIQDLFGLHICIKKKTSAEKESEEKLLNIFHELTVGISEVFSDNHVNDFDEFLRCDRVSCKINVLNEQIGQVRTLYSLWKSGYNLDPKELADKCRSLNLLVDCIRDDVFYAYLQLPPEKKVELLRKNKQVSAIFSVLGLLENEVTDMVKTMMPNGEILKLIRPLLRPEFNKLLYRKAPKNLYNYNVSDYMEALRYSCKEFQHKRFSSVDASTDPVAFKNSQMSIQYKSDHRNIADSTKVKLVDKCISTKSLRMATSVSSVSLSSWSQKYGKSSSTSISEGSSTDTKDIAVSTDEICSVAEHIDDSVSTQGDLRSDTESSVVDRSLPSVTEEKSQEDVSFWRVAADLIADKPVLA